MRHQAAGGWQLDLVDGDGAVGADGERVPIEAAAWRQPRVEESRIEAESANHLVQERPDAIRRENNVGETRREKRA